MYLGDDVTFQANIVMSSAGVVFVKDAGLCDYNDFFNNGGANVEYNSGHGTGNIESNPDFTAASAGDFSLQGTSPCIDAGNPTVSYLDVDGSTNDMGAFGGPGGAW